MRQIYLDLVFFTTLIIGVLSAFSLGYLVSQNTVYQENNMNNEGNVYFNELIERSNSSNPIASVVPIAVEACRNNTLEDKAYCLARVLKLFYKYNITNAGKEMSFDEIVEQGGVCSHYANLYKEWILQLNGTYTKNGDLGVFENDTQLYVSYTTLHTSNTTSHKFTIMSSSEGYCILDQLVVRCVALGGK
jgi:hypothetical protein